MVKRILNKIGWKQKGKFHEMHYGFQQGNVFFKDTRVANSTVIVHRERLVLEDNVFIGHFNFIESSNGIRIGEGCQITNYISILTHSSHNSIRYYGKKYRYTKGELKGYHSGRVDIGMYTFIGPHSTIMPNTRIGKGCVVQGYSLVKGDFPDFSIIGGNPAVVIGSVKERDEAFLKEHPDLVENYNEWAQK